MGNKLMLAIIAGIIATAIMTGIGLIFPSMGLPKMNPAEMVSEMLKVSLGIGYIIHFMVGIIFASAYVYWFNHAVKINSRFLKGAIFGIVVFVFAQIMLWLIGMILPMPMMENMMM